MHDYTWIPKEARDAAERFRMTLYTDYYLHSAAVRMIRAIVDHARAVRIRCDARVELLYCEEHCIDSPQTRIVHGLAKFSADMTRRDLPRLPIEDPNILEADAQGFVTKYVSESTRDAGHDLLVTLICDVDVEAGHG